MAGAPTKGIPTSLLSKPSSTAPSEGDTGTKPGPQASSWSAASDASVLQHIASLRRGTATRQAAFRAAKRRERSRRSKVAASGLPLLALGMVSVPAIAFATTGGSPAKATQAKPATGTASQQLADDLTASSRRPRHFGGDWSDEGAPAPAAPTSAPAQPAVHLVHPAAPAAPASTGTAVVTSSQGRYLGTFVVTCYDLGGHTATGATPSTQTVAVDPRVIPLGTRIDIAGVGDRIAQDTGGAIKGHRLDIWEPTYSQCAAWGVQDRQVWIG